jgi:WD40 repeat protein/Flp pilus assembly protein TadD
VNSAQFSPDGKRILTVSMEQAARLWDAQSGELLDKFSMGQGALNWAQFSPDGEQVVIASGGLGARGWQMQSGQPISESLRHQDSVISAQFSPEGQRIVTASRDQTARVWNAQSGQPITEPLKHEDVVLSAQFSPDGKRVVTASGINARVWDAQSGRPSTKPLEHQGLVHSAQFSPDGQRIVTASSDQTARVWDSQSGQSITQPLKHQDAVLFAQFSPDGKRVVTASRDQTARVWDTQSSQATTEPLKHHGYVCYAQFSPDGKRVVTASWDQTARVWDAQSAQPITEPLEHEGIVLSAQFSPDGKRVVTASGVAARVWDAQSGQPITTPLKHHGFVRSAQFSPDGKWVVTASYDKTAQVWDAQSGQPIMEPLEHKDIVLFAQFSPDGKRVVTASGDDTARVWDLAPAPEKYPDWLISMAETISSQRLNKQNVLEDLGVQNGVESLNRLREQLGRQPGDDDWVRWGRWFLADPSTRTISPFSTMTVVQYIENRIKEQTDSSLSEAESLAAGNDDLLRRISEARVILGRIHHIAALEEQASALSDQGKLEQAQIKYDEALALAPSSPGIYLARGESSARWARWNEARADFSKAIELDPDNHEAYHFLAPALVQSADLQAYDRCRAQILARFGGTNDPAVCERMAKDCLILSCSESELATAGKLAQTAVSEGRGYGYFPYFEFANGLAEYRTGNFASAVDWMRKVLTTSYPVRDAQANLVLAMSQQSLNRPDDARAALAAASAIINSQMPKLDRGDLGVQWNDWIIAHALWREAKAMIGPPPAKP